jgi:hypothetical protein
MKILNRGFGAAAITAAVLLGTACPSSAVDAVPKDQWQKKETLISANLYSKRNTNFEADPVVAIYARQEAKLWATTLANNTPKVEQSRINTWRSGLGASNIKMNVVKIAADQSPAAVHAAKASAAGTFRDNAMWSSGRRFGIGVYPHKNGGWILVELFVDGGPTSSNRRISQFRTADGFLAQNYTDFYVKDGNWTMGRAQPGVKNSDGRDWGNITGSISGNTGRGSNDGAPYALWADIILAGQSAGAQSVVTKCAVGNTKAILATTGTAPNKAAYNDMVNSCRSVAQTVQNYSGTNAYKTKYPASMTNAQFVIAVYKTVNQNQTPSTAWVNASVAKLNAGKTRQAFISEFVVSADAKNGGQALVSILTATMLDRPATAAERSNVDVRSFDNNGKWNLASWGFAKPVLNKVLTSNEYATRASNLGLR